MVELYGSPMDDRKKVRHAVTFQLRDGEAERIAAAVARVPLASKNKTMRAAVHLGLKVLASVDPTEAAQMLADFEALPALEKFGS